MPTGAARALPSRGTAGAGSRCFVAVWPDAAAAECLDALAARLHARHGGTRRMRRANLHLTLAFIGDLASNDRQRVANAVAAIEVAPFDWRIDRIGAFDGAQVLWAGSDADANLSALAARVRSTLDALAVRYDRKAFVPHVTLLRNLSRSQAAQAEERLDPPLSWPVRRAALLQSTATDDGPRYRDVPPETHPD